MAKATHARQAGASNTINYKEQDVAQEVLQLTGGRGVDVIIDMDLFTTAPLLGAGCLAEHGTIVSYGSSVMEQVALPFREVLFRSLTLKLFVVYELLPQDREAACAGVHRLLSAGLLQHTIGASFPLSQIVAAHETVERGNGIIGNITIRLDI